MDDATEPQADGDPAARAARTRALREALADLWRDYHWPTKLVLALIVVQGVWGAAAAGWPRIEEQAAPVVVALLSDSTQALLTLLIALLVAVDFYARARRGVLDGDEHYNVARALAFGYFKNFLVPALRLAERTGHDLMIFRPRSMAELRRYSAELDQRLRGRFEHAWMPLVDSPTPGGPPRRTVLALQRPLPGRPADEEPFFFDAPTALFTVDDFYAALNRRRAEDGKAPLNPQTVLRYQNGQIDSFFRHLDFLFRTEAGLDAVADLVPDAGALAALRTRLRQADFADLDRRYPD